MVARNSLMLGLFAFAAWGQTSEKVFYFAHLDTPQAMQEVANMVRGVSGIRDVLPDAAKHSLTVKGTADQIAAAAWLTAEMDKPGGATGTRDFPFNDPKAPLLQVAYLSHVDSPQQWQEIVNTTRSILDVQRCFPMSQQKAIVMGGPAGQLKAADWLLSVLDRPAGVQPASAAPPDYRLPAEDWSYSRGAELVVRVVFLTNIDTAQALQEVTNATRSMADMMRLYPVFSRRALAMRGNDDQMALADWLLKQFDGPAGQGTKEYKIGGAGGQIVQVAYVDAATPDGLSQTASQIRTDTKMASVFPLHAQKAVAMRGTADQLARAQQVIQSRQGK
jgi:hypothetical protein